MNLIKFKTVINKINKTIIKLTVRVLSLLTSFEKQCELVVCHYYFRMLESLNYSMDVFEYIWY